MSPPPPNFNPPPATSAPWLAVIHRWRQLPAATRHAVRWSRVPRQVALSFAFEREPVDEAWLTALRAPSDVAPTAGRGPTSAQRLSVLQVSNFKS